MLQSHAKVKLLVRSHAMREETSPPPDPDAHHIITPVPQQQQQQQLPQTNSNNSLSVGRPSSRHKLRHQGSSQGSMDSSSPCLSRGIAVIINKWTNSGPCQLCYIIHNVIHKDISLHFSIEFQKWYSKILVQKYQSMHYFPHSSHPGQFSGGWPAELNALPCPHRWTRKGWIQH